MISRKEALILLNKYLKDKENLLVSYSVENILRKIADMLGKDEDLWSMTGLLFNLDYEYTIDNRDERGNLSSRILEGLLPKNAVNAIKANNYIYTDYIPATSLDKALISSVAATEFIIKVVRNTKSQKISDVTLEMLIEKFNDNSFISDNNKSRIKLCKDLEFKVESFLEIVLQTLKEN